MSHRSGSDPGRSERSSSTSGILLVDKAPDRTSHDVVARVRWLLGTKKVGHAGTLDPMATGLLVLGVGQGTRLLTHLVGLDKTYTATIRLGVATTTDDREGEALGEIRDARGISDSRIEEALTSLRGDIQQVPSTVSAIKIDGQRAYARVRAGEDVTLAARPVRVTRFEITGRRECGPHVDLDAVVSCSSGTYVRALARDLGEALSVGGHLTALRRTRVGPFDVADALHVPARGEGDDVDLPLRGLGATAAQVLPVVTVDDEAARALADGKRIPRVPAAVLTETMSAEPSARCPERPELLEGALEESLHAARDPQGRLCAILRAEGDDLWRPTLVVPAAERS